MILNIAEVAELFGVSQPTVRAWLRQGAPYTKKGGQGVSWEIESAEIIKWREDKAAEAAAGYVETLDYETARRQKMAAEAKMVQLDLAQRCRQVVLIEDVDAIIRDEYSNARARFLALPGKLAGMLEGMDINERRACIEEGIREALSELAADGDFSAEEGAEDLGTATGTDG